MVRADTSTEREGGPAIDLVIPTHNRAALLQALLGSIEVARGAVPSLRVHVIVVASACHDTTRSAVVAFAERFGDALTFLELARPGKSAALNVGIAAGNGALVGMVDDDERLCPEWFAVASRAFEDPTVAFIGGPYVGDWQGPPPAWWNGGRGAIVGEVNVRTPAHEFQRHGPAMLMGGNAVVRREWLEQVGPYREDLGPVGRRHLTGEDRDMFLRLLDAGARGRFVPELRIAHHIAPERLTRRYHRRWCLRDGQAVGRLDRDNPEPVRRFLGMPRYRIGSALQAAGAWLRHALAGARAEQFDAELTLWSALGFMRGRWLRGRAT